MNPALNRAYDIRGIYPTEVNRTVHEAIGRAFAAVMQPKTVAVGMDVRVSGPELKAAVIQGLRESGVNVIDVGILSTDMVYFAAGNYGYDGAIIVSASHNPSEYNGAKMVSKGALPLTEQQFRAIVTKADQNVFASGATTGTLEERNIMDDYIEKCLTFVDVTKLKPLKIVANPNFGSVCYSLKALQKKAPFELIPLNGEPDGTFPKGRPDPLVPETREETIDLIQKEKPAFGVAWDGDGDRCFFYDEDGDFIDGYYVVSILARYFLQKYPQSPIPYDSRIIWATVDTIQQYGGTAVEEKVGHTFFKATMRRVNAVYGGEMSAHHYFRDFFYCDNGLIPFLIIWQMVSEGTALSDLVRPLRQKYPASEEINFTVADVKQSLVKIEERYRNEQISHFDGISVAHGREWRANVRGSNNEPLLRLNVEAKTKELVDQKVAEFTTLIQAQQ